MEQRSWIYNPNSLGLFFGLALTIGSTAAVQGQDVTFKDLRESGREAFENGKYEDAVPSLRLALQQAITNHASDTMIVLALNDLAEALRIVGQNEKIKSSSIALSTFCGPAVPQRAATNR